MNKNRPKCIFTQKRAHSYLRHPKRLHTRNQHDVEEKDTQQNAHNQSQVSNEHQCAEIACSIAKRALVWSDAVSELRRPPKVNPPVEHVKQLQRALTTSQNRKTMRRFHANSERLRAITNSRVHISHMRYAGRRYQVTMLCPATVRNNIWLTSPSASSRIFFSPVDGFLRYVAQLESFACIYVCCVCSTFHQYVVLSPGVAQHVPQADEKVREP